MGTIAGRKVQINPDGSQTETYVDVDTGQPIADPTNYFVYDYATLIAMGIIDQKPSSSGTPIETVNKEALVKLENNNSMWAQMGEKEYTPRSPENNYGYKSQPKALGFAQFLPGLLGTVGKGVALVGNANNTAATSSARETLNLKPQSGFATAKSLMVDQKGKVADVQYKGSTIPVGLDALDRSGRTQMTPDEARRRQAIDPTFRESTKEESKAAVKEFKQTYGSSGILGWALNKVKSPLAELMVSDNVEKDIDTAHTKAEKQLEKDRKAMPSFGEASKSSTAQSISMAEATGEGQGVAQSLDGSVSYGQEAIPKVPDGVTPYDPRMNSLVNTNFSNIRDKPLNDLTTDQLNYAAFRLSQDLGTNVTIEVGSGGQVSERDPAMYKKPGGWTGSVRHNDGGAADVSLYVDGQKLSFGNKEGKAAFSNFAKYAVAAGATGIGAGTSYMGNDVIHIGQGDPGIWGGASWLKGSYDEGLKLRGSQDYNTWREYNSQFVAPKPEARPSMTPSVNPANEYAGTKDQRSISPQGPIDDTKAKSWVDPNYNKLSKIDDKTKGLMAKTLAGEQLSDNQEESYGILSSIIGREGKYGSVEKAIMAPKQFSTWNNPKAIDNMNTRYEQDPEKWDGLVGNFLKDPSNLKDYTSYHADYVKPSWSKQLQDSIKIGDHIFGKLPEYKTKGTSKEVKEIVSSAQKGFVSPSKPTTGWASLVPETKTNSGSYGSTKSFSKPLVSSPKPTPTKSSGGSYNVSKTTPTSTPKSKTTMGPR